MENNNWKALAKELFFAGHMSVGDICMAVKKTRKYVSACLQECEGYEVEKQSRKIRNAGKRKEYQREWDRNNRGESYAGGVNADTMRREHEVAVRILSSERY